MSYTPRTNSFSSSFVITLCCQFAINFIFYKDTKNFLTSKIWYRNYLFNFIISKNPIISAGRTTGGKGEGDTKLLIYQFPVAASVAYYRQGVSTVIDYSDLIAFVATTGTTRPIQFTCNYPIWHGDSGSALIADISGTKKIIGLCFAGSTNLGVACRIDRVATAMNISAWNGEPVNFSDTSNIMEYTVNGLSDLEYIDFEGKRYWQVGLRKN